MKNKDKKAFKEEFEEKLKKCEEVKDKHLAGWQRERADFLNYKKGESERVEGIIKYAYVGLISKFLPVLDNLDIAEKKIPEKLKKDVNVKGLLQIKEQIKVLFKAQGVEEVDSLGKEFDPSLQELVGEIDLTLAKKMIGKKAKIGLVVEEVQKGYKIHGRLLRPAKVKIVKYTKIKNKK